MRKWPVFGFEVIDASLRADRSRGRYGEVLLSAHQAQSGETAQTKSQSQKITFKWVVLISKSTVFTAILTRIGCAIPVEIASINVAIY